MRLSAMLRKALTVVAILSVTWALNTSCILSAKEHPEHPEKKEHPKGKVISNVTLEDVAKFAEEYVQKNSRDGIFKHYDKNTKKELELTLDKVHRERLSQINKDEYFVCADFKGKDGNTYDLDFFVQGKSKSYLNVDKKSISIHKVNGKENYSWNYNEKKGVWQKKTIKTEKEQPEQPEHPKPDYP